MLVLIGALYYLFFGLIFRLSNMIGTQELYDSKVTKLNRVLYELQERQDYIEEIKRKIDKIDNKYNELRNRIFILEGKVK